MSTTTVQVQQFKFNDGKYRNVEVPSHHLSSDTFDSLEQVFHYGQNDFQPQSSPSVSVGDVINLGSEYYIVQNFGFKQIKSEEYDNLKRVCNRAIKNGTRYDVELYNEIGEAAFKIS
jgi:hypothetical protein